MCRYFTFFLILIFNISGSTALNSQTYFIDYDDDCSEIYVDITDLKLDLARQKLATYKQANPNNLAHIHLSNYIDFFEIFISENKSRFKLLEKNKSKRITLLNEKLPDDNPYKKFVIAEVNLQWAISRAKFNQLFRAGREIYQAYSLLEHNNDLYPEFVNNKKSLSFIHALIETIEIPGIVKKLLGMTGSIQLGVEEILEVVQYGNNNNYIFNKEAEAIYTYILFFQANKKKEAFDFIKNSKLDHRHSLLANFLKVKIAQRAGYNDVAIEWLGERPDGEEYAKFYYLYFLEGLSKLRALDPGCIPLFKKYVDNFKGQHYIKEAYQKLAWAELIFNHDINLYNDYMKKLRQSGEDQLDGDKQALLESKSDKIPNPILLKARLLFDGGYYIKAINLLNTNKISLINSADYSVEFHYRMGRISQALNKYPEALSNYDYTINDKAFSSSYYSCNAALQSGLIYEEQKNFNLARKYFKKCLNLSPIEYKNSLHQKANSGLQRLSK